MKKIVLASAAMGGAALLAFGASGTFAAFSDEETITGNEASAGTLLLDVGGNILAPVSAQDMAPGDQAVFPFFIRNAGSGVDGRLGGTIADVIDYEDGCTDPERAAFDNCRSGEGSGELSQQLTAAYYRTEAASAQACRDTTVVPQGNGYSLGTLANPTGSPASSGSTLLTAGGPGACFLVVLTLPSAENNNLVQSDNVSFSVDFQLIQDIPAPAAG